MMTLQPQSESRDRYNQFQPNAFFLKNQSIPLALTISFSSYGGLKTAYIASSASLVEGYRYHPRMGLRMDR